MTLKRFECAADGSDSKKAEIKHRTMRFFPSVSKEVHTFMELCVTWNAYCAYSGLVAVARGLAYIRTTNASLGKKKERRGGM